VGYFFKKNFDKVSLRSVMQHCYAMERQEQEQSTRKGFALNCLCDFMIEFDSS
jgi:hypothetical protein